MKTTIAASAASLTSSGIHKTESTESTVAVEDILSPSRISSSAKRFDSNNSSSSSSTIIMTGPQQQQQAQHLHHYRKRSEDMRMATTPQRPLTAPTPTRKRSFSDDTEEELVECRKSIFLSSGPHLSFREDEMRNVLAIRRCNAFDEGSSGDDDDGDDHDDSDGDDHDDDES